MTKNDSLNGSETIAGGTIIMPIDISTAATTRSIIKNGRKIRKPIWNARDLAQHEGWHQQRQRRVRPKLACAVGTQAGKASNVSGSTRAAMNCRNGSMRAQKRLFQVRFAVIQRHDTVCQAATKTGSITK